jgi:F0F1-type ATP synthase assembly protein I
MNDPKKNDRAGLVFLGLGFELMVMFLVGAYVGGVIDKHMGWPNYGFLGMIVVMLIAWILHFVFLIKRFMKDDNDTNPQP